MWAENQLGISLPYSLMTFFWLGTIAQVLLGRASYSATTFIKTSPSLSQIWTTWFLRSIYGPIESCASNHVFSKVTNTSIPGIPESSTSFVTPEMLQSIFISTGLRFAPSPDGYPIEDFVKNFVAVNALAHANRVGSWEEHVASWMRMRQGKKTFCLVRYEDLLTDPTRQLRKASPLLQIEPTAERIERAIKLSSAERMRSLEKLEWRKWTTTKHARGYTFCSRGEVRWLASIPIRGIHKAD